MNETFGKITHTLSLGNEYREKRHGSDHLNAGLADASELAMMLKAGFRDFGIFPRQLGIKDHLTIKWDEKWVTLW